MIHVAPTVDVFKFVVFTEIIVDFSGSLLVVLDNTGALSILSRNKTLDANDWKMKQYIIFFAELLHFCSKINATLSFFCFQT